MRSVLVQLSSRKVLLLVTGLIFLSVLISISAIPRLIRTLTSKSEENQPGRLQTDTSLIQEYKYFQEAGSSPELSHYDARFYRRTITYSEHRTVLTHLIRAYLQTFARLRLETWLAHGTLLGWWWNGGIMPWDVDVDAQVTGATLALLADHHNGSLHEYEYEDDSDESSAVVGNKKKKKRTYLLDVNPFATARLDRGTGANVIDARWVDVDTGMYVDLTALADRRPSWELEGEGGHLPTAAAVMLSCKNGHTYRLAELFPLRETEFEGVPALVPWAYERVLIAEYGAESLILTEWEGHRWDPELKEWVKKNETNSEKTAVKHLRRGRALIE